MLFAASPTKVTLRPGQLALVLAHGEQVRDQLAGVELVGQRVDDRDAGGRKLAPFAKLLPLTVVAMSRGWKLAGSRWLAGSVG